MSEQKKMPSKRRRADLVTRMINGETIILDSRKGTVHHLNATAGHIWRTWEEAHSPFDVARRVAATFNHAPQTVLQDVLATLADFERLGLLVDEIGLPSRAAHEHE